MRHLDPSLASKQYIFPSTAARQAHDFQLLPAAVSATCTSRFASAPRPPKLGPREMATAGPAELVIQANRLICAVTDCDGVGPAYRGGGLIMALRPCRVCESLCATPGIGPGWP
jgi:hypothetical protein